LKIQELKLKAARTLDILEKPATPALDQ